MAPKRLVPVLITLMLITGVCNTLLTKYQDNICVRKCHGSAGEKFEQPVIQTLQMFIGETASWLFVGAFYIYKRYSGSYPAGEQSQYERISTHDESIIEDNETRVHSRTPIIRVSKPSAANFEDRAPLSGWRVLLLSLPAICDICGTTLMNIGLLFVVPSIYQMTRGALVLFVGLFSVIFLKRNLKLFQWFALAIVVFGVGVVGLAGASFNNRQSAPDLLLSTRNIIARAVQNSTAPEAFRTVIGVFLIAGAQIFTAIQFVLEEFILEKYALEPLKVVGWEGLFGFLVTATVMIIMHVLVGRTPTGRYGYFDMEEGWREVTQNRDIRISSILIMISIGGFNYFGLSVTQNVSATARSTIDTCRTLFIWIVSLFLGWETFKWLQVVGFTLLVYGTFLFNNIIKPPMNICIPDDLDSLSSEDLIIHQHTRDNDPCGSS